MSQSTMHDMNLLQPGQIPIKAPVFEVAEIGRFVPVDRPYLIGAVILPMTADVTGNEVRFSFEDGKPFYPEDCAYMETANPNVRGTRLVSSPIEHITFRRPASPKEAWECLLAEEVPGARGAFMRLGNIMTKTALKKQKRLLEEAALHANGHH